MYKRQEPAPTTRTSVERFWLAANAAWPNVRATKAAVSVNFVRIVSPLDGFFTVQSYSFSKNDPVKY